MRNLNYLQCDSESIIRGIQMSGVAQHARLYFRPLGDTVVGESDCGDYRQLKCRATSYVRLLDGNTPTIVFETEDGDRFVYTTRRHAETPNVVESYGSNGSLELHVGSDERILARETEGGLEPVGYGVVFEIPDHAKMSPQLNPQDEREANSQS